MLTYVNTKKISVGLIQKQHDLMSSIKEIVMHIWKTPNMQHKQNKPKLINTCNVQQQWKWGGDLDLHSMTYIYA